MPIYIPLPFFHPSNPLLIKCSRIYQYRSGIHRMSHNGHCVIRTVHKNDYDRFHWNGDGWCHIARKKRIAGTALDFYARRSRNCVVEHAQLGYLQKVAYFLLWVCWETPQNQSKAHALSARFIFHFAQNISQTPQDLGSYASPLT